MADIHTLHDVLNELRLQNSAISHSLSNQHTYVKNLSTATNLGTEAVANLSNIVKDHTIRSHDQLQRMAGEIMWLNVTFFGQSALHEAIRQLEFTLLQLQTVTSRRVSFKRFRNYAEQHGRHLMLRSCMFPITSP